MPTITTVLRSLRIAAALPPVPTPARVVSGSRAAPITPGAAA